MEEDGELNKTDKCRASVNCH